MNRKIVLVALAVMLGAVAALAAPIGEDSVQDEASEALAKLESLLPDHPALAEAEVVGLMREAAETRRLDAAYLLIRGLAFNFNPNALSEALSLSGLIPAVSLLKRKYGDKVLPILFVEGISAKESWLRTRIAFTIREIADPARIAELSDVFSLKTSQADGAKELATLLAAKKIDVKLYDPTEEMEKDLIERLKRLDEQHQGPKTN
jgi:hypothetical protein